MFIALHSHFCLSRANSTLTSRAWRTCRVPQESYGRPDYAWFFGAICQQCNARQSCFTNNRKWALLFPLLQSHWVSPYRFDPKTCESGQQSQAIALYMTGTLRFTPIRLCRLFRKCPLQLSSRRSESVGQLDKKNLCWVPSTSKFANIDAAIVLDNVLHCAQYTISPSHSFHLQQVSEESVLLYKHRGSLYCPWGCRVRSCGASFRPVGDICW